MNRKEAIHLFADHVSPRTPVAEFRSEILQSTVQLRFRAGARSDDLAGVCGLRGLVRTRGRSQFLLGGLLERLLAIQLTAQSDEAQASRNAVVAFHRLKDPYLGGNVGRGLQSGHEGRFVELQDALDGCERILNEEFAEQPERSLYMIGQIDEAKDRKGATT